MSAKVSDPKVCIREPSFFATESVVSLSSYRVESWWLCHDSNSMLRSISSLSKRARTPLTLWIQQHFYITVNYLRQLLHNQHCINHWGYQEAPNNSIHSYLLDNIPTNIVSHASATKNHAILLYNVNQLGCIYWALHIAQVLTSHSTCWQIECA